jgi:hypothetical protein
MKFVSYVICFIMLLLISKSESESLKMIELNYGKYQVPEALQQVLSLQEKLNDEGVSPYGDLLGLYFSLEGLESRYLNTPLDVISFARPGVDGIHYGFLTDFGTVNSLEEAYIVRVSPMDFDDPVKLVARNLNDFLQLLGNTSDAVELLDTTTSKQEYDRLVKEYPELTNPDLETDLPDRKAFIEAFHISKVNDLYGYFQRLKEERQQQTVLPTPDGIGVVYPESENGQPETLELERQETLELEKVESFFNHATFEAKLAFLRDAQSKGLIYDHEELKQYLKNQLIKMNLRDEAVRIDYPVPLENSYYQSTYRFGISMISNHLDPDEE